MPSKVIFNAVLLFINGRQPPDPEHAGLRGHCGKEYVLYYTVERHCVGLLLCKVLILVLVGDAGIGSASCAVWVRHSTACGFGSKKKKGPAGPVERRRWSREPLPSTRSITEMMGGDQHGRKAVHVCLDHHSQLPTRPLDGDHGTLNG